MRVVCRTNLYLNGEQWPRDLPAVPRVGDSIQSATEWRDGFHLELQVVGVTWRRSVAMGFGPGSPPEWYPEIELHMTDWQRRIVCADRPNGCDCADGSICAFYHWYAPLVGRSVASFI